MRLDSQSSENLRLLTVEGSQAAAPLAHKACRAKLVGPSFFKLVFVWRCHAIDHYMKEIIFNHPLRVLSNFSFSFTNFPNRNERRKIRNYAIIMIITTSSN